MQPALQPQLLHSGTATAFNNNKCRTAPPADKRHIAVENCLGRKLELRGTLRKMHRKKEIILKMLKTPRGKKEREVQTQLTYIRLSL